MEKSLIVGDGLLGKALLKAIPGYDFGVEKAFERGAYRKNAPIRNASLRPPHGTGKAPIAPPHGTETSRPVPPRGAIRPISDPCSIPPGGHPLEVTISGVQSGGSTGIRPTTCRHPDCKTLTLGREFCAKHRKSASANVAIIRPTAFNEKNVEDLANFCVGVGTKKQEGVSYWGQR